MKNDHFYQELKSFNDFSGITENHHFCAVPGDWKVIITDVKGSTIAVENGKYKDVNFIGAATIVAATKGMGKTEFPFVFGGDGATLIIPSSHEQAVVSELLGLKELAKNQYKIELRVGAVSVSEIISEGGHIDVAKFELCEGKSIAIIKGGGLSIAERKIKQFEDKYCYSHGASSSPDLSALSCRWQPVPSHKGVILTILVESRDENQSTTYQDFLDYLIAQFKGHLEEANPIDMGNAKYRSFYECVENEMHYHDSIFSKSFIHRFIEIIISILMFKYNFFKEKFKTNEYVDSIKVHSDYRKFDDMLRMIIDCSSEQADAIENYLEKKRQENTLYYGIHKSENALMTCFVDGLSPGKHIHFIDGGSGGYTMAAKQLKMQMNKVKKSA